MKYLLTLLFSCWLMFISFSQTLSEKEGYINVQGGRVWYKIIGNGKKTPLLFIHGGPGSRSCTYISPFSMLGNDRPIIVYDQLGTGRSDRPTDSSLWQLPRFINEIDSIRKALGLTTLHIVGHSWGGAVLAEYLLAKQPKGVVSAIFVSPYLGTPSWMADAKILVSNLPQHIRDTINKYENLKEYRAAAYLAATDSFYARHMSLRQWPPAKVKECDSSTSNTAIYQYMWGASEFNVSGTLKSFDRVPDLKHIQQPVLFIAGQQDETRPATMATFHKKVKGSKLIIIPNSGHLLQIDQAGMFISSIKQFIDAVE
jgi:proline iminopeptidase